MKIKNIFLWLREKLSDPHFFRNLFSYRKMWGAFSIYSHKRRSDGKPNISYSSHKKAVKAAESMSRKYGVPFIAYKCLFCDGWHIAKDVERVADNTRVDGWEVPERKSSESIPLNYDAIKATNVPDLHYVYGGFRGATLSSPRQAHAWRTMIEGGIGQIIDLRSDVSPHYEELCRRSGVAYFRYPIANDDDTISEMVEYFREFCSLIDKGKFYIACAMGLHRTDIALCLYWMFYAADRGVKPPVLYGYTRDSGHNTLKIMRIMDKFQNALIENGSFHILPEHIFSERKRILNQQAGLSEKYC